ncbi:MAG TPA: alpha/beta fold hydrolase, partial [Candidatus Acidoferrales bacterium]|nr:alpha/beta fold hydrolase [Candidatus Acidoferrales bacterium]
MMTALWIFTVVVGPVLILTLAGVVYQAVGAARDARRYPPRGRLVRVDGRQVHIHASGEGSPTVVLESGMGASTLSWSLVRPLVAEFARVVSYDRAGAGWSDLARTARTADAIAEELHTLLAEAGIAGPYVLVGHSFGAYVLQAFVGRYPDEVQGMVLVDPIHPDEWRNPTPQQQRVIRIGARYARVAAWLARVGFVRFCLARFASGSPRLGR